MDPLEWTNLAKHPEYAEQKAALAKWLPQTNLAPPNGKQNKDPDKKAKKQQKREKKQAT
jgi:hypothetical protein